MDTNGQYKVEFTKECRNEIEKIYSYIKDELFNESAAHNLMNKLEEYVSDLEYSPRMYAEIDKFNYRHL